MFDGTPLVTKQAVSSIPQYVHISNAAQMNNVIIYIEYKQLRLRFCEIALRLQVP